MLNVLRNSFGGDKSDDEAGSERGTSGCLNNRRSVGGNLLQAKFRRSFVRRLANERASARGYRQAGRQAGKQASRPAKKVSSLERLFFGKTEAALERFRDEGKRSSRHSSRARQVSYIAFAGGRVSERASGRENLRSSSSVASYDAEEPFQFDRV